MLKKSIVTTIASIAFLTASSSVFAGGMEDMGPHHQKTVYSNADSTSSDTNYAIHEGQWSVAARAGIAPTMFSNDIKLTGTIANVTGGPVTIPSGNYSIFNNSSVYRDSRKFDWGDLYDLPFTASAEIAYGIMNNLELFLNFDYSYAAADDRRYTPFTFVGRNNTLKSKTKNYNSYAGYVGGRFYVDIDSFVTPFVGAKLGFLHRTHGKFSVRNLTSGNPNPTSTHVPFFRNSTGFSGGLQLGFDYRLSDVFSIVAMAEAIGSTGIKYNKHFNQVRTSPGVLKAFSQITRSAKSTLSFPLTMGVKLRY
ncbi:MAG: hypothetical protein Q8S31_00970 [Alphaproteobacteria bacterium]|nr:hypothetical protein [Alphaproteobacteria bacterium]